MSATKVEIICFTDPYCCWCWATEPVLFRLRETYREQISMRYVMGGLVKDMATFHDASNDISATAEVMPHWKMVGERTGQPIDERLMGDITDPHFSTWPACRAVKAAQLQGNSIGEAYLRRMRRAALTERKYVSLPEVYINLAKQVASLDMEHFILSITDGTADQAFKDDMKECARYGARGFPTVMFQSGNERLLANGYHSFDSYNRGVIQLAPGIKTYQPRDFEALLNDYGPLTTREFAEILVKPADTLRSGLETSLAEGSINKTPVPNGEFWSLAEQR